MALNFAANISFLFAELPFPKRFLAAANAGFTGVEFLFPYEYSPTEIAELVQRSGVTLALHNLPPGDWGAGERGLAAIAGRQDEFKQSVETALVYAQATGLKQMHVMAGCVGEAERTDATDVYLENLSHATKRFADAGISALIEPINSTDMPGYFLTNTDAARSVIEQVGARNLRIQFDCYHAQIMSGDALGTLGESFSEIAHIQIASVPDRREPDHGDCDYTAIFTSLDCLGYDGWIGCEYHPLTTTEDGLGWRPQQVHRLSFSSLGPIKG